MIKKRENKRALNENSQIKVIETKNYMTALHSRVIINTGERR